VSVAGRATVVSVRRSVAGVCLFGVIVLGALSELHGSVWELSAAVPAWVAAMLLLPEIQGRTRNQSLVLLIVGLSGLAWGWSQGVPPAWSRVFGSNATIIAMLAAVNFLRLITAPGADDTGRPPSGRRAVRSTLAGVHLLGAVGNLSTVHIMAPRMIRVGGLQRQQAVVLSRGVAAAALWSPFFAAMPAALTYAPGAQLSHLSAVGLPLALLGLVITTREVERAGAEGFTGYPMRLGSLWLPALLALAVLAVHGVRPDVSVLGIIAALAPTVTALTLTLRREPAVRRMLGQITGGLPLMASELALFLSAGVLAAGLQSLIAAFGGQLPIDTFGGVHAALLLAVLVVLAAAGVHPVIGVAAASSLLAPTAPDNDLLAITFLGAWSIGVAVSPLSALTMGIQAAYGIRAMEILRWNARYALVMVAATGAALWLYARVVGV